MNFLKIFSVSTLIIPTIMCMDGATPSRDITAILEELRTQNQLLRELIAIAKEASTVTSTIKIQDDRYSAMTYSGTITPADNNS